MGPGDKLAERYIIQKNLANTSRNQVFTAIDVVDNKEVIVKFSKYPNKNEIEAYRKLSTFPQEKCDFFPHLYDVVDTVDGHGNPRQALIIELVVGETLTSLQEHLTPDLSYLILGQLLHAIACMHDHSLCHGDIHGENIIWDGKTVKIIDFEFSRPNDNCNDKNCNDILFLSDLLREIFRHLPPSTDYYNRRVVEDIIYSSTHDDTDIHHLLGIYKN